MNKETCILLYCFTLVLTFQLVASKDSVVKIIIDEYFNNNKRSGRRIESDLYGSFYSDEDFLPANEFTINDETTYKMFGNRQNGLQTHVEGYNILPYRHDLMSQSQPQASHERNKKGTQKIYEYNKKNNQNSLHHGTKRTSRTRNLFTNSNLNGAYYRNETNLFYPKSNRHIINHELHERVLDKDYYNGNIAGNEYLVTPQSGKKYLNPISYDADRTVRQKNRFNGNEDYLFENDNLKEYEYRSDEDFLNYPGTNNAPGSLSSKTSISQNNVEDYLNEHFPNDKKISQPFDSSKPEVENEETYGMVLQNQATTETIPNTKSTSSIWFDENEPDNPKLPDEVKLCNPHSMCRFPFDEDGIK